MMIELIALTQIIVESLPISSSTHVLAVQTLLAHAGYAVPVINKHADALLHIPAIGIVICALWHWYGDHVKKNTVLRWLKTEGIALFGYAWLSTGVTLAVYFLPQHWGVRCCWPHSYGLMITALLLLLSGGEERKHRTITWWRALIVGALQAVALLPGVSRLGATFAGGRLVGWSAQWALTYSFILQLILMSGAFVRAMIHESFISTLALLTSPLMPIVIVIGSIVSYAALRLTMVLAQKRRIWVFVPYLILLSLFLSFFKMS